MYSNLYRCCLLVLLLVGTGRHPVLAQPGTLAVGNGHSLAIHADGTLWACGYNGDGRLGDGTTTTRVQPVQIGTGTTWRTVSTGGGPGGDPQFNPEPSFVLALKADGSLWSWGDDFRGALGYYTTASSPLTPHLVAAGPWACASAGKNHGVAVRADGTLWTWGDNVTGQLGEGGVVRGRTLPAQVGTDTDWASVSAGTQYTLALKTNGTLWAWGELFNLGTTAPGGGNTYVPTQVGTATNWVRISAGQFSLAIRADGTLWGWGANNGHVLDPGNYQYIDLPQQLGTGTSWSRVASGDYHALATKTDGTLWSWGANGLGSLGIGSTDDSAVPVQVGTGTTWRRVAAGGHTSAADQANGTLWTWGDNQTTQTGDPALTTGHFTAPVQVGAGTSWAGAAGTMHTSLGLQTDGSLWSWGSDVENLLGDGARLNRQTVARIDSPATYLRVRGNIYHTLAIRADSSLWAWGRNAEAELGDGTLVGRAAPVLISAGHWKHLAAGSTFSLAIRADGTLWAWGENYYGQLGDGTTQMRTLPVQIGTSRDWAQVECFGSATLALRTDGTLWAWGLGYGAGGSNLLAPARFGTVATWAQLATSDGHILARRTDGSLWAWGSNSYGQLGDGTTNFRSAPVRIGTATDWATIVAGPGSEFSMALKRNGTLWTWGNNNYGQLGYPTTASQPYRNVPTQVGAATWTGVAAGSVHSLAVRADGTLWAWGNNRAGQAGIPSFSLRPASVQTGMRPFSPFSLTTVAPGAGIVGTTVTLTGMGLGTTQLVTFGGMAASGFTVNAAGTILTVTVPTGARSGAVAVFGPDGAAWGATAFQVLVAPVISSFTPASAAPGTTVTVSGTGLTGTTTVQVGSMTVTGFVVNAAGTSLTFTLPSGSTGGLISVGNPAGTATSATPLAIVLAAVAKASADPITVAPVPARMGQPVRLGGLPVGAVTIVVVNSVGQRVASAAWPATHSAEVALEWLPATPGLYILTVQSQTQVVARRILVE